MVKNADFSDKLSERKQRALLDVGCGGGQSAIRLKELYPDVNIKIFYQKDFRRLLQRFGIATAEQPLLEGGGLVAKDLTRDGGAEE